MVKARPGSTVTAVVRSMLVFGLFWGFFSGAFGVAGAAAQAPELEAMAIDLKPGATSSAVVVVYAVQIAGPTDTREETTWRFPVPAGSTLMGVYEITESGTVDIDGAAIEEAKDGSYLSFATRALGAEERLTAVASYAWEGVSGAEERSIQFRFRSPYDVQNAVLKVTEPGGSEAFTVTPAPAFRTGDGTIVDVIPLGAVEAGRELAVDISYRQGAVPAANAACPVPVEESPNGGGLTVFGVITALGLGVFLFKGISASRLAK